MRLLIIAMGKKSLTLRDVEYGKEITDLGLTFNMTLFSSLKDVSQFHSLSTSLVGGGP